MVGLMAYTVTNSNWEPKELRTLKRKLANLSCKCRICEKSKNYINCTNKSIDKEVQYEQGKIFFPGMLTENLYNYHYSNSYAKCLIPLNIVRGGIFKDEGSETTPENYRCDKSTGHSISVSEKSTSIMNKQQSVYFNLSLCDFISECSDYSIETSDYEDNYKLKAQDVVKFTQIRKKETGAPKSLVYNADCSCLDHFMDSIRPPF